MPNKFFLPSVAPLRESIPLGSIVPDLRNPQQDNFTYSEIPLEEGRDYLVREQDNLGTFLRSSKSSSFRTMLTNMLSASFAKREIDSTRLAACKTRVYELRQPKQLFNILCGQQATRDWFQSEIEYGTSALYFVVGYYTLVDATLASQSSSALAMAADAQVPVGGILSGGATAAVPDVVSLDVGAGGRYSADGGGASTVKTAGERIYAFAYRKVSFKWYSPRSVDAAFLKAGNRWNMTADNRAQNQDEEENEVVEADLEEEEEEHEEGHVEAVTVGELSHKFIVLEDN